MTIELYIELKIPIENRLNNANRILQSFDRKANGMCEVTEDFIIAKKNYSFVFNELRILNKHTPNKIKREYSKIKRNEKLQTIKKESFKA